MGRKRVKVRKFLPTHLAPEWSYNRSKKHPEVDLVAQGPNQTDHGIWGSQKVPKKSKLGNKKTGRRENTFSFRNCPRSTTPWIYVVAEWNQIVKVYAHDIGIKLFMPTPTMPFVY